VPGAKQAELYHLRWTIPCPASRESRADHRSPGSGTAAGPGAVLRCPSLGGSQGMSQPARPRSRRPRRTPPGSQHRARWLRRPGRGQRTTSRPSSTGSPRTTSRTATDPRHERTRARVLSLRLPAVVLAWLSLGVRPAGHRDGEWQTGDHPSTRSLPRPPQRRQHDQPSMIPGEAHRPPRRARHTWPATRRRAPSVSRPWCSK
jgi:hypothetical protein